MYQDGVARGGQVHRGRVRPLVEYGLDNAIEPVEGLVVDNSHGRSGLSQSYRPCRRSARCRTDRRSALGPARVRLRRHKHLGRILDTLHGIASGEANNIFLVDNGGFANLVPKFPYVNVTSSQTDPNVQGRAYKAAWMVDAYTMSIMNLTRPSPDAFAYLKSKVSNKYPVTRYQTTGVKLNGICVTNTWTSMLDPEAYLSNYTLAGVPSAKYSNPFGLTSSN
ncbi:uncharacterized protein Z520_00521 [Fonsecaea multimorphosa CBS 102226]|uniref:Uncharacterized protein n=1 Tax=Fonsecaea multimorphosa CBS 102226 TaxID=1442371 RepID=A0A0D2KK31_9EURO|nr:uncharacterized protein Z520_00521 [Fonsecaea multimorphosa CBS 102226]KIY03830.1 hypothetical protein Z520_00521 [Fonsecaea multimorphosa CBS 102226]